MLIKIAMCRQAGTETDTGRERQKGRGRERGRERERERETFKVEGGSLSVVLKGLLTRK